MGVFLFDKTTLAVYIEIMKVNLTEQDTALSEHNRVVSIMKKYNVSDIDAQKKGILARAAKVDQDITKDSLKGQEPDEWDIKNINELIKTYELAFPYPHKESLQLCIEENEKIKSKRNKKGTLKMNFRLPVPFSIALKQGYPVLLTDKVQSKWFRTNFPQFSLIKENK